jgi:hypothetical protein
MDEGYKYIYIRIYTYIYIIYSIGCQDSYSNLCFYITAIKLIRILRDFPNSNFDVVQMACRKAQGGCKRMFRMFGLVLLL